MIRIFFNYKHTYSEQVATFKDEETYHACLPALEELAKKNNFTHVSESYDKE